MLSSSRIVHVTCRLLKQFVEAPSRSGIARVVAARERPLSSELTLVLQPTASGRLLSLTPAAYRIAWQSLLFKNANSHSRPFAVIGARPVG